MKKSLVIVFSILLGSISCSKEEDDSLGASPISEMPEISIEKITPNPVNQFESLVFEIAYTDGDGDIGDEDADVHSLEITDRRDGILHTFHIPPQAPDVEIVIKGVFVVELENLILLDQSNDSEEAEFSVRLRDRAGNWSDIVISDPVTINK